MASIILSYDISCAGAKVVVAPMDGGTINGSPGGKLIAVGTDGTLSFNFQAPTGPGRHHVVTRLGGVETTFPFDVADPGGTTTGTIPNARK